jgi:hypothetical protein
MSQPTYDPKDRVHVTEVKKRGEWYEVKGRADGRDSAAHIHAKDVESKNGQALIHRTLLGVAQNERR